MRLMQLASDPDPRVGKAQWIRALDVVAIGPLMIWGGVALHDRSRVAGWALGLLGVGTIALNGYNWLRWEVERRGAS